MTLHRMLTFAVTLIALVILPQAALAQSTRTICGDHAVISETLTGRFGEERTGWGLGPQNRLVELYSSAEASTWTIIITSPSGTTCLIASGSYWQTLPLTPAGDPL